VTTVPCKLSTLFEQSDGLILEFWENDMPLFSFNCLLQTWLSQKDV
jgi:hypothetical protein